MEPSYFFYMILPLAVLVVFLVVLVIHYARKEDDDYENEVKKLRQMFFSGKLDKKTFVNQRSKLKNEKIFAVESKKLLTLLDLLKLHKLKQKLFVSLNETLKLQSYQTMTVKQKQEQFLTKCVVLVIG